MFCFFQIIDFKVFANLNFETFITTVLLLFQDHLFYRDLWSYMGGALSSWVLQAAWHTYISEKEMWPHSARGFCSKVESAQEGSTVSKMLTILYVNLQNMLSPTTLVLNYPSLMVGQVDDHLYITHTTHL